MSVSGARKIGVAHGVRHYIYTCKYIYMYTHAFAVAPTVMRTRFHRVEMSMRVINETTQNGT